MDESLGNRIARRETGHDSRTQPPVALKRVEGYEGEWTVCRTISARIVELTQERVVFVVDESLPAGEVLDFEFHGPWGEHHHRFLLEVVGCEKDSKENYNVALCRFKRRLPYPLLFTLRSDRFDKHSSPR